MLQRPRIAPKIEPGFFDRLRRMLAAAELVTIAEQVAACRDPDDDKFLELAMIGNADAIISGDANLFVAGYFSRHPDHHGRSLRTRPSAVNLDCPSVSDRTNHYAAAAGVADYSGNPPAACCRPKDCKGEIPSGLYFFKLAAAPAFRPNA